MKSSNEIVLLYHFEQEPWLNKFLFTCMRLHIKVKKVAKEDYSKTIGELLKISSPKEEEAFAVEMTKPLMVMYGFQSRSMDQLLLTLRKNQVPKIDYKAVVTESNKDWSGFHLYEEVAKEHEAMSKLEEEKRKS